MAIRGHTHRFGSETGACSEREGTGVVDTAVILAVQAAGAGPALVRERPEIERDAVETSQTDARRANLGD